MSTKMTLRQYAAIKLKVPDSGTDWLDDMILKSLRNDFAAKAIPSAIEHWTHLDDDEDGNGDFRWSTEVNANDDAMPAAELAFRFADAMLEARK